MNIFKFFILILTIFSCDSGRAKNYKVIYKVYYPQNTILKEYSCYCFDIQTYSSRGSNSIRYREGENFCSGYVFIEDTSVPIEIVNIQQSK